MLMACCSLLVACADTSVVKYDNSQRAPTTVDSIKIYDTKDTLPAKFKVIGVVTTKEQEPNEAIQLLKQDAAKLGGQGIILDQQSAGMVGVPIGSNLAMHQIYAWTAKVFVIEN